MLRTAVLATLVASSSGIPLQAAPAVCPDPTSPVFFFPQGTFGRKLDLDTFVRKWYSKQLSAMREPSLSCGVAHHTETYRFTWLRTFHHPIAVRVSWSGDAAELTSVELDGAGGYEPGNILKSTRRPLPEGDGSGLRASVQGLAFWAMPTQDSADLGGADGAQWILEGRRGDDYHVVERWSPETGAYREVGLQFLRLAGISVPSPEVY